MASSQTTTVPDKISDEELLRRIQRERRFIERLSRPSAAMKDFEQWAVNACRTLAGPHTLADAQAILSQWQSAREALRNRRWIPFVFTRGGIFAPRLSDVEIVDPWSWDRKVPDTSSKESPEGNYATPRMMQTLLTSELRGVGIELSDNDLEAVDWFAQTMPPTAIGHIVSWLGRVTQVREPLPDLDLDLDTGQ